MTTTFNRLITTIGLALSMTACNTDHAQTKAENKNLLNKAKLYFKPLSTTPHSPKTNPTTPEKIALGKMLFYDPRLSKSGALSCNSCHNLKTYGVDNLAKSIGHKAHIGKRNSPTVLNASLHFSQFWDGRAADLETQATGPILSSEEMGMTSEEFVMERLQSITEYQEIFEKAFKNEKDNLSYANVARSIAAFERTLLTPSPFDNYLAGDTKAISKEAQAGLQNFINYGCTACHNGTGIGGNLYQKFGIFRPYPYQKDTGRFQVTKEPEDKYVFKVPSLRNVARTAPYFHDGKVETLNEAIHIMATTQLNKDIPESDVKHIKAFLESLTGNLPEAVKKAPNLPGMNAR